MRVTFKGRNTLLPNQIYCLNAPNTTELLCPPNPNELESAMVTLKSCASFGTTSNKTPSSGSSWLMVGCTLLVRMLSMHAIASSAPDAPSWWPSILFVEFSLKSFFPLPPKTAFTAATSHKSPTGVDVPCAFTKSTSSALIKASLRALSMQRITSLPSARGLVRSYASVLMPPPMYSHRMTAPRFFACAKLSITKTPAPSPITNPSRPLSHGRLAPCGSSFRLLSALHAMNPAKPIGVTDASVPPARMTSAWPFLMCCAALMNW
mmetsp:Transcript_9581/g.31725  ORF Transcript_9581/g.31725 Transcript_9581/m.31725 type:complete len:264 (+) Transcript_9581:245-1036(+)